MRKPDEHLDYYSVKPATSLRPEPPRAVSLWLTGEVEVLEPLIHEEVPAMIVFKPRSTAAYQPLWFRRLITLGSLALAMIALVLLSAIFVGISDPAAGPDVATDVQPDDKLMQTEVPFGLEMFSPMRFAPGTGIDIVRATAKRKVLRPRVQITQQPQQYARPLQPDEPKFVPTTLVIYAEDGVIKTRIEPWVRSS